MTTCWYYDATNTLNFLKRTRCQDLWQNMRTGSLRLSLIRYPGELQDYCLVLNHVPIGFFLLRAYYVGNVIIMLYSSVSLKIDPVNSCFPRTDPVNSSFILMKFGASLFEITAHYKLLLGCYWLWLSSSILLEASNVPNTMQKRN